MSETTLQEFVERKDYSRIRTSIDIPDLIEIQKRSYEEFLQLEVEPERRKDHGLAGRAGECLSDSGLQQYGRIGVLRAIRSARPSTTSENALSRA